MAKSADKLSKLEQQQQELADKIKREKLKIRREQREREKRKVALVGELVLANIKQEPDMQAWLEMLLDDKLSDPRDRVLFGLKPKNGEAEDGQEAGEKSPDPEQASETGRKGLFG